MSKTTVSYKIFITPDRQTGNGKEGYTVFVPKLGIADDGYTIEEALKNIRSLIKFHLNCLIREGEPIPAPDTEDSLVTTASVEVPVKVAI